MKEIKVEVLADEVNFVVLRTPGRNYPGMVIQGDSLRSMHRLAELIRAIAFKGEDHELRDDADDLCERLRDRIVFYEQVLDSHSVELPYPDRVS